MFIALRSSTLQLLRFMTPPRALHREYFYMTSLFMEYRMVLMGPERLISLKCSLIECSTRLYDLISWGVTRDQSMSVLFRKSHSRSEPSYVRPRTFTLLSSSTDNVESPTMKVPIFSFLNPYTVSLRDRLSSTLTGNGGRSFQNVNHRIAQILRLRAPRNRRRNCSHRRRFCTCLPFGLIRRSVSPNPQASAE